MSKKKRKKRKKNQNSKKLTPPVLALRAKNHLTSGRFRQAVADYKTLMQQDRDAYLPGLRAAYKGLYKQRLDKAMLKEAAMILSQIENLPGDEPCLESIRLLFKKEEFAEAAAVAAEALAGGVRLSRHNGALAADALVTALEEHLPPQTLPESVCDHLQRIETALQAVAAQNYSKALAAIKVIGLQSIFFSWKCLIKGYCSFYRQEDSKALAAFKMIADETIPKAAAAPYRALLAPAKNGNNDAVKDPDLLEQIGVAAGYPKIAPVLARAEYLWQVGRFRDSHTYLLNNMEHFSSISTGLTYTLSEFYYNACFKLPDESARKYFSHLRRLAESKNNGNVSAQIWASRSAALYLELEGSDERILEQWEHFLTLAPSIYSRLSKVQALVYGRLGNLFSEEIPDNNPFNFFFSRRRRESVRLRDPELANYCYEKSLAADPNSKDTQLALIRFFEKTNDNAGVNRQLDQMIKQFPEEKDVLFKAGVRCMDRKALVKAMNYLSRALTLDSTDRAVRENYCIACIRAAHNYALKRKADKCRILLPKVIAVADVNSDHFNLGRTYLYARWAAFELLLGNDIEADQIWQKATAHKQAGELKLHFFYWVIAQHYGVSARRLKKHLAFIDKALKGVVDPATAAALAATLLYIQPLSESIGGLYAQKSQFDHYIFKASNAQMTRPQAKTIIAYAMSDECGDPIIVKQCVDTMLQHHPEDAFFRYYHFFLQDQEPGAFQSFSKQIRDLETILQLARQQKETQVIVAVQKRLNDLKKAEEQEIMDDPEMDLMDDFDEDFDEQALEVMLDLFDSLKRSSQSKKETPKQKQKNKGPKQLDFF
jgi:hypothetical protein